MKSKNKNYLGKLISIILLFLILVVGLVFTFLRLENNVLLLILVVVIVIVMCLILKRLNGLENSRKLSHKEKKNLERRYIVGSRAFVISLYWLLVIMWAESVFEVLTLTIRETIVIGLIGMVVIYGASLLWLNKKGARKK